MLRRVIKAGPLGPLYHSLRKKKEVLRQAVRRRLRWRRLEASIEHLHGAGRLADSANGLVVLTTVRDGRFYVGPFIEHYRALGAGHIVVLDNGSEDDTVEVAIRYPDVTVLRTTLPFKAYKYMMRQYLFRRFGRGRWALYADIDEFFDYPASDRLALPGFLDYLSAHRYNAVVMHMLDMFSAKPLPLEAGRARRSLVRKDFPYYDLEAVEQMDYEAVYGTNNHISNPDIPLFTGGIRKHLFGTDCRLFKHSLVFFDGRVQPMDGSAHHAANARVADVTGVLYHYKFTDGFYERVRDAVQEGSHYGESMEYRQYLQGIEGKDDLHIVQPTSRRLGHVDELVEAGFVVVSDAYRRWVEQQTAKPAA